MPVLPPIPIQYFNYELVHVITWALYSLNSLEIMKYKWIAKVVLHNKDQNCTYWSLVAPQMFIFTQIFWFSLVPCITAILLMHCVMLCSFYKYENVEVYLLAVMLLNVQLFPRTLRWVLGNSEMKLCNV